jgi:hypothetical protein
LESGSYSVVGFTHAGGIEVDHVFGQAGRDVKWQLYDEGVSDATVRRVLNVLPDAVMECKENDQVRTPLGVFKIVRRRRKRVRCPSGSWSHAPERIQARIRPGKRLQRQVEDSASDLPTVAPDENPED